MIIATYAEKHPSEKAFLKKFKIIASDINQNVINRARSGIYSDYEVSRGLPDEMKEKYFTSIDGKWVVADKIK